MKLPPDIYMTPGHKIITLSAFTVGIGDMINTFQSMINRVTFIFFWEARWPDG